MNYRPQAKSNAPIGLRVCALDVGEAALQSLRSTIANVLEPAWCVGELLDESDIQRPNFPKVETLVR